MPYYKHFAGIKEYDVDLDVKDWNEYNDGINNSSKRIDPNDQIYHNVKQIMLHLYSKN